VAQRKYLLVGVTGGIGSGKSAVCREFELKGRVVLSADSIARDLTNTDPEVKGEIRQTFGPGTFMSTGDLDRKALANIVFHNASARRRLNRIVHPRVFRKISDILRSEPVPRLSPYTIVEAALVFESEMDRDLDYVIVVDAPEEDRIRWTMGRDGCNREEVLARIDSQMSVHTKRSRADFVLENVGTLEDLRDRVTFLNTLLCVMASGMNNV
jgi:dephospho-CoA kinase